MSHQRLSSLLVVVGLILSVVVVDVGIAADPISRVSAQVFVTPNRVRMILSQFTDDLVWLHGMEANEQGVFEPETLREFYELHRTFLGDSVQVIDSHGKRLTPVLVDEGPYPFADDFLATGATEFHLIKRTMNFTYEWASPEPLGTFTIRHHVSDENFLYPAEMSIDLFQGESDLPLKAKLRLNTPMTIDLDWEQPVPSMDAPDEEKLAWLARQDERLLGVTNFGSVYLWGYVEPRSLRVELLLPLNVVATLIELQHSEPDFLLVSEFAAANQQIRSYFSAGNSVTVNGSVVQPKVQGIDYFPADQRDFALRRQVERISLANGRVGLTLSYPYKTVPQEIVLAWDKFNYALPSVQAYLFSGTEVQSQLFSRQLADNRLQWQNPGTLVEPQVVPVAVVAEDLVKPSRTAWQSVLSGAVCLVAVCLAFVLGPTRSLSQKILFSLFIGFSALGVTLWWHFQTTSATPAILPNAADRVSRGVLENIYGAFEFVQEEAIYTALEQSAAGPQLRKLYLQLLSDLQIEDQNGSVSSIESIDVSTTELIPDQPQTSSPKVAWSALEFPPNSSGATFRQRIAWNLSGLVEHWGHTHQRTNQYQGVATFVDFGGTWKLVDLEIETQTAGSSQPQPNRFTVRGTP